MKLAERMSRIGTETAFLSLNEQGGDDVYQLTSQVQMADATDKRSGLAQLRMSADGLPISASYYLIRYHLY